MAAFNGQTHAKGSSVTVAGKPGKIEAVGLNGWYVVDGKSVHHSAVELVHKGDPAFAAGVRRSIRTWTDKEVDEAAASFRHLGPGFLDTDTYRVIDAEQAFRAEVRLCRGFEGRCVACGTLAPAPDHEETCKPSYEPAAR